MKKNTGVSLLWAVAIIFEWINVALFILAMGYEVFDYEWYNKLKSWEYIAPLYYTCGAIDVILFAWLANIYRKTENLREIVLSVFCCLVQIGLLIWKIKL